MQDIVAEADTAVQAQFLPFCPFTLEYKENIFGAAHGTKMGQTH